MSEFTSFPKQDSFETTLQSDIDAVVDTIGVNLPPDFALATGSCYAVIDYDKPNTKIEIINFTGVSGNNLTGCTRGFAKYEGGATTAQTHASGAKVIISDNWQTWKDISDAIASKFDSAGGTIGGNVTLTGNLTQTGDQGVTGDVAIDGTLTVTTPLAVAQGGTGANNDADARTNLNAAESGANSDITSLSGLTTPLDVPQGGTGAATHTAKNLLVGNGTSAFLEIAPGTASQVVISNGTDWIADDPPIVGVAKKLLSSTNTTDGNDDDVARGSIIVGNSTPKWSKLAVGAADTVLSSDGTDISWATKFFPHYVFSDTPFAVGIGDIPCYLKSDGLVINSSAGGTTHTYTRANSSAMFNNVNISTSNGLSGGVGVAHYVEGGTDYILGKKSAVNTFSRCAFVGSGGTDVSISGTAPSAYTGALAYDSVNGHLLVRDGVSTTIIRYTISGTTITNINSDITLSANPTAAKGMWCDGTYIYIVDFDTSHLVKRYNMSGILQDISTIGSQYAPRILIDIAGTAYIFAHGEVGSNVWSTTGYKMTIPQ